MKINRWRGNAIVVGFELGMIQPVYLFTDGLAIYVKNDALPENAKVDFMPFITEHLDERKKNDK